jgi:hypothetical protein
MELGGLEERPSQRLQLSRKKAAQQVGFQLFGHCQGQDTALDTLNRLFCKNYGDRASQQPDALPRLTKKNFRVKLDWMTPRQLERLKLNHTRKVPKSSDEHPEILNLPIVTISDRKFGCVVDGTTRINRWLADRRSGPQPAYSIRIKK